MDANELDNNEPLTDDDIVALLRVEHNQAAGYQNTRIQRDRIEAMRYYLAEPYGDEIEERSKVVTTEVRDTIESLLPQLVKLFMSSDRLVRFEADTQAEEAAADQATDYINHVINVDNDGFMLLYSFFKDALLQKNGVIKMWWDETLKETEEEYEGLNEEELMMLLTDDEVELMELTPSDVVSGNAGSVQPGLSAPQGPPQGPADPQMPQNPQQMGMQTFDAKIMRRQKKGRAKAACVPPEEFLITTRAPTIQKSRYVAHKTLKTISELIEMGIPKEKVWDLSGDGTDGDLMGERQARFDMDGNSLSDNESLQHSMRTVWVTEAYYLVDTDGDGIAERWRFLTAGSQHELLLKEKWHGDWPFVSVTPVPMTHKFYGLSMFDLVRDIQRIKSTVTRQLLDNMYQLNNARMIVQEDLVNLDDLLTNRPGGIVRSKGSPSQVAMPLSPQPLGQIVIPTLEYLDSVNERRTGVTAYNQGIDANSLNKTATGISIINSAAQERMLLVARIFAETGVKEMFSMLLRLTVRHQDKARTIKLRGKWETMDPSKWNSEMAVTVDVALGSSNRMEMISILQGLLAVQKEAMAVGAPIVDWKKIHNTLAKMVEAAGLKSVETYFNDPENTPPKPDQPSPEMIKAQADQQKLETELQAQKELELFKAEQAQKKDVLQIGLKKMDIASRERIAKMNTTTDLLGMLNTGGGSEGVPGSTGEGSKRPSKISIRRNPITREIEEIVPIYERMQDALDGGEEFNGYEME